MWHMASFIDRFTHLNDWDTDGGGIEPNQFTRAMDLYATGVYNAAALKSMFNCTTGQGNQLDTILATQPASLLTLVNAVSRAQWAAKVSAILMFAANGVDFTTDAAAKTALGI